MTARDIAFEERASGEVINVRIKSNPPVQLPKSNEDSAPSTEDVFRAMNEISAECWF